MPKRFKEMSDFVPDNTVSGVGHSTLKESNIGEIYGMGNSRERALIQMSELGTLV
jgi:hypothetical protein